jgi:hypothetical protein
VGDCFCLAVAEPGPVYRARLGRRVRVVVVTIYSAYFGVSQLPQTHG